MRNSKLIISIVVSLLIVICSVLLLHRYYIDNSSEIVLTTAESDWLKNHDYQVTIGADPYYPPLDFIDSLGNHRGLSEDIFQLIEKKLNFHFIRYNPTNWDEMLILLKNRRLDVVKCAMETPERVSYLSFTKPYLNAPIAIIVRQDDKATLTLPDLDGQQAAVVKGYSIHEYISSIHPKIKLVAVSSELEALNMVASGEVKYAICDMPVVFYLLKEMKLVNLRVAGEIEFDHELSIGVRNDWPILKTILDKALQAITSEEKQTVVNRWVNIEYDNFVNSRKFWYSIILTLGFILLVALLFMLWNHSLRTMVRQRTQELNDYKNSLEKMVEERTRNLHEVNQDLSETNSKLQQALDEVKTLSGFLPICSSCKQVRDDQGYWKQIEEYLSIHSDAQLSHSICPDCLEKLYPDFSNKQKSNTPSSISKS